jgi:hypothetical protein
VTAQTTAKILAPLNGVNKTGVFEGILSVGRQMNTKTERKGEPSRALKRILLCAVLATAVSSMAVAQSTYSYPSGRRSQGQAKYLHHARTGGPATPKRQAGPSLEQQLNQLEGEMGRGQSSNGTSKSAATMKPMNLQTVKNRPRNARSRPAGRNLAPAPGKTHNPKIG